MPIYEYECKACGFRHEALQKVSDGPLTECPNCNENSLKKLISAASFRLSGSGWYETDFKSDNKRNLARDDSQKKDTAKENKKDSKKPDKKVDTKSSAKSSSDSSKKSSTKTTKSNKR